METWCSFLKVDSCDGYGVGRQGDWWLSGTTTTRCPSADVEINQDVPFRHVMGPSASEFGAFGNFSEKILFAMAESEGVAAFERWDPGTPAKCATAAFIFDIFRSEAASQGGEGSCICVCVNYMYVQYINMCTLYIYTVYIITHIFINHIYICIYICIYIHTLYTYTYTDKFRFCEVQWMKPMDVSFQTAAVFGLPVLEPPQRFPRGKLQEPQC